MGVVIAAEKLEALITRIFEHTDCDSAEAARIAHYLMDANLTGHDSHGVIRTPRYVEWLENEICFANREMKIVQQNDVMAIIDGQRGFGQV